MKGGDNMNETKHTAGKWTASVGWHKDKNEYAYIDDDKGNRIAILPADFDKKKPAEIEANVILLAAAPSLYEALKDARQVLEMAGQYFPKSMKNRDRFMLLSVLANSIEPALSKAEGKA